MRQIHICDIEHSMSHICVTHICVTHLSRTFTRLESQFARTTCTWNIRCHAYESDVTPMNLMSHIWMRLIGLISYVWHQAFDVTHMCDTHMCDTHLSHTFTCLEYIYTYKHISRMWHTLVTHIYPPRITIRTKHIRLEAAHTTHMNTHTFGRRSHVTHIYPPRITFRTWKLHIPHTWTLIHSEEGVMSHTFTRLELHFALGSCTYHTHEHSYIRGKESCHTHLPT